MSHPAHFKAPAPRFARRAWRADGKPRDLDGHDCRRRDPSNRDAPTESLAREHILRIPPKGHTHPQLTALITARPMFSWLGEFSVTAADSGEGGVLTVPGERLWENGPGFESRWVL